LREERRLRVFQNRVLRRIFGPKRDENKVLRRIFGPKRDVVTEECRKLNDELNDPYCSPNIVRVIKSRRMRWAGHVACMGERRGVYRVLMGKPEGKRPLGRTMCNWEDNMIRYDTFFNCKWVATRWK
jgi:hypothetical protein